MAVSNRVGAVDFWRGIVLVAILFEHIPGNLLDQITHRNFGFSDCSEVFVFLAGVSTTIVYYKRVLQNETTTVVKRCFSRAFRIYTVHIVLTLCGVLIFAAAYSWSAMPDIVANDGHFLIFTRPLRGLLSTLLLSHQIAYFNILPMYVVMMLWAPVVLAVARRGVWLAVGMAVGIYAVARTFGAELPSWPVADNDTWFFNPIAWQLIFSIGIVAGIKWARTGVPFSLPLLVVAIAVVALSFFVVRDGLAIIPGVRDLAFNSLDVLKRNLGLVRLVHFLALAYIVSQMPAFGRLAATAFGQEVQRIGRYSLPMFAFGSLFCCAAQALLTLADGRFANGVEIAGFLLTIASAAGLVVLARAFDRGKQRALDRRLPPVALGGWQGA